MTLCKCGCEKDATPEKTFTSEHNQQRPDYAKMPVCHVCGEQLTNENWHPSRRDNQHNICKSCYNKRVKQWRQENPDKARATVTKQHRKNGALPYDENNTCSAYLGVHVAERVLRHVFKDIEVMPYGNVGYDFICNKGKKIDVKSACFVTSFKGGYEYHRWQFHIRRNTIADYFLCLAFDNREDLNPLHAWMLPCDKVNHLFTATISPGTIHKWDDYKLDINKVVSCCNVLRNQEN